MSAAEAERPPHPEGEVPFDLASPAAIRAALTPQDAAGFDRQWREVLATAAEQLDLTPVLGMLDAWRRVAWMTSTLGPDGYRQLMATTNDRARTNTRPAGSVPWATLRAELGL